MLTTTYWIILILILISIVELLRRKVLREKYAIVWLGIATALIFGAIFPGAINSISKFLGFQVFSNFVLFIFATTNLLMIMQITLSIGKTEDQVQTLAEEIALLKSQISEENL